MIAVAQACAAVTGISFARQRRESIRGGVGMAARQFVCIFCK
jgi:hypothetical protein